MTRLPGWQEQMRAAKRANADFFYPQEGDWTRQQNGRLITAHCRFSVQDPDRVDRAEAGRAQALATQMGYSYADLRIVKVHPDDPEPSTGMVLAGPFDGGRLEIVARSQPGKLSRQRTLTALIRRGA